RAVGPSDGQDVTILQRKRHVGEHRAPSAGGGDILGGEGERWEGWFVWHRPAKFTIRPRTRAVACLASSGACLFADRQRGENCGRARQFWLTPLAGGWRRDLRILQPARRRAARARRHIAPSVLAEGSARKS